MMTLQLNLPVAMSKHIAQDDSTCAWAASCEVKVADMHSIIKAAVGWHPQSSASVTDLSTYFSTTHLDRGKWRLPISCKAGSACSPCEILPDQQVVTEQELVTWSPSCRHCSRVPCSGGEGGGL